jgi:hypothetical protein
MKLGDLVFIALLALFCPRASGDDLPSGVPNPIGPDGKWQPRNSMFTTQAYQKEALKLMLHEANQVAAELELQERLPIEATNLVEHFVVPFGYAHIKKAIGTITTENYVYSMARDDKFCYLVGTHQNADCRKYQEQYMWSISRTDTNQAYQLATQWLTAVSMDVKALNRDYSVVIETDHDYIITLPGKFVPIYDVYWHDKERTGSVASVRLFTPTKTLLELRVEDPKYILRKPLVFTNLVALFQGVAKISTNHPVEIISLPAPSP